MAAGLDPAPILDDIRELAADNRLSVTELGRGAFDATSGTESAQGVMARLDELVDHDADSLARARPDGRPPFLVVLDGVTDPGNLGAVLRTADGAGATGVLLPRHRSARVSPTVTKAAAGAIEHLPIGTVAGIPAALARLKELGVWVVGLDETGDVPVWDLAVATEPLAVVLGAEGKGLSRLARERCDTVARVPLTGHLDSLNVSAAAAVTLFAIARARAGD
jgi:23S rRNA (guanosine2251-2'-O)-methyltransferase